MGRARIGCSGWNYRDWRGAFYPPKLPAKEWLTHYATRFDTVEVNTTFYRLPNRDAVAHWVEQTPPDFEFTVKASRYLTHVKRLTDMAQGVARFSERIEPLVDAGRLGPVLWQLPPNFRRDDDRLAAALDRLPPGRHAFEFRDASWFVAPVCELLDAHDAAFVIAHDGRRELPAPPQPTRWHFVRLHFGAHGRGGNYSDREIDAWADTVTGLLEEGDAYVYLNNDWQAFAPRNAARLARRVSAAAAVSAAAHPPPTARG